MDHSAHNCGRAAGGSRLVLNSEALLPVIRRVFGNAQVTLQGWSCKELHAGPRGSRVYCLSGMARDHSVEREWNVILKTCGKGPGDEHTERAFHWKREALLYQSGLLSDLAPHVATPKCWGIHSPSSDEIWIWLECARGFSGGLPSLSDYRAAGRALGRLNGLYLMQRPLPRFEWLSRSLLRDWVRHVRIISQYLARPPKDDFVERMFPSGNRHQVLTLLPLVDVMLHWLDRAPQTFCHLDCHRRNFIVKSEFESVREPVLLDWALAGIGALGQDLSPLITVSTFMFDAEGIPLAELESSVTQAYLEGLKEVGSKNSVGDVRIGYGIDATLRFLGRTKFMLELSIDTPRRRWWETVTQRSVVDSLHKYAQMMPHMLSLAAETARRIQGNTLLAELE